MIKKRKMILPLLPLFFLLFSGCAGTFKHTLQFNPEEPIRVAVLPFVQLDQQGQVVEEKQGIVIDEIGLVSSKLEEGPAELVRKLVQSELSKTSLDMLSGYLVDVELPHHGFGRTDGSFDLKKIQSADSKEICVHFLDCDAVLYGKVTRWERSYYGLETINAVGVELKLVSVRDGKVLFQTAGEDSDNRGLSKGPTGYASLVIEPVRGLDSDIIINLARSTVQRMLQPLHVKHRPEFLTSSPPSIYATAHDIAGGVLERDGYLTVLMYGSPKKTASFSIGQVIERVPMVERDDGHYYGEYYPLPTDGFSEQPVMVHLMDKYGRVTQQTIARTPLTLSSQDLR